MLIVSSARKFIYGEDLLASLPVRDYIKAMGTRPAVRKVNEDRKANTEVMMAARAAKKPA